MSDHQMIDYIKGGRQAVVRYLALDLSNGTHEIGEAVLDTGCDVPLYGPRRDVEHLIDEAELRQGKKMTGITGHSVPCEVFTAHLNIAHQVVPVEVYVSEGAPAWILGLPVLRRFHLLLAEGDRSVSAGSHLRRPPLLPNGGLIS